MDFKKRLSEVWPQYLLSFIFPALTLLAAFAITQCYPFGKNSMLTVDLYHQYAPFLVEFRNKLLSGESILYSWNDGLGQEYYASFANYTASPLNLLCVFFTAKTMPVFIWMVTCLRSGLASVFMLMFLSANDNKRIDNITVVFASSYALCGWFISYFWNIMWCDAVVLLPLVCLGLRKLFTERRPQLYIVSLAALIASNYYSGFFVCLFLVMFAPVYYLALYTPSKDKNAPLRLCPKTMGISAGLFAGSSVLAGGITAVLTVPTYFILQHCSATGDEFPTDYALEHNLFDFLGRFFASPLPAIRDGMANVYCGLVIVILLPLFFFLPRKSGISLRTKVGFATVLVILYLSFNNRTLNFIWHGMHFPNQIPYRESFLMCFLLVFIGFLTIRRIRSLSPACVMGSVGCWAAYLMLYEKFDSTDAESYIPIGVTLLFLFVQGAALKVVSSKDSKRSAFFRETVLTVTMLIEIFVSATLSICLVAKHEGFANYAFFGKNYDIVSKYAEDVEGSNGHLPFERTELFPNNICDIQSVYDVKGMSIFSSTARESFVKYMRNFGFHNNGINGLRNAGITRVTASFLGVRNLAAVEKTQTVPYLWDVENTEGDVTFYGNPDALSVGFMVDRDVLNYVPDYEGNLDVFDKTNSWLNSMGVASDVYAPVMLTPVAASGFNTTDDRSRTIVYSTSTASSSFEYTVLIDDAEIGSDIYIYANSNKGGTATIENGSTNYSFEIRSYQIISCGVFDGTPIKVTVSYREAPNGALFVYGYQLDQAGYRDMLDTLGADQLNVTEYDETHLTGTIDVSKRGLLMLTVPYSEGWTCVVDGKEVPVLGIGDALMGIELSEGSHDIGFTYAPEHFKAGALITVTCLTITVLIFVFFFIKDRKKAKAVPVELPYEEIGEEAVADNLPEETQEDPDGQDQA
ncbi:MAG: YfhO family protein [Saccharofermentans sp.]|nr:YfhO family protein [Saccharofermentans sp.]